jgi:hypothetical protein
MPRTNKGAWRSTELDIVKALKKLHYASARVLGKELNLTHKWVESKLRILKAAGKIYIADWEKVRNVGDLRRVYGLRERNETDLQKPKPKTAVEKTKAYRLRKKQKELLNVFNLKSSTGTEKSMCDLS